jgi:hypothetical protein
MACSVRRCHGAETRRARFTWAVTRLSSAIRGTGSRGVNYGCAQRVRMPSWHSVGQSNWRRLPAANPSGICTVAGSKPLAPERPPAAVRSNRLRPTRLSALWVDSSSSPRSAAAVQRSQLRQLAITCSTTDERRVSKYNGPLPRDGLKDRSGQPLTFSRRIRPTAPSLFLPFGCAT